MEQPGISCRCQLSDNSGVEPYHMIAIVYFTSLHSSVFGLHISLSKCSFIAGYIGYISRFAKRSNMSITKSLNVPAVWVQHNGWYSFSYLPRMNWQYVIEEPKFISGQIEL